MRYTAVVFPLWFVFSIITPALGVESLVVDGGSCAVHTSSAGVGLLQSDFIFKTLAPHPDDPLASNEDQAPSQSRGEGSNVQSPTDNDNVLYNESDESMLVARRTHSIGGAGSVLHSESAELMLLTRNSTHDSGNRSIGGAGSVLHSESAELMLLTRNSTHDSGNRSVVPAASLLEARPGTLRRRTGRAQMTSLLKSGPKEVHSPKVSSSPDRTHHASKPRSELSDEIVSNDGIHGKETEKEVAARGFGESSLFGVLVVMMCVKIWWC